MMPGAFTIRTRYESGANGAGRMVAVGLGRRASVPYAHALNVTDNHEAAARKLAERVGLVIVGPSVCDDLGRHTWQARIPGGVA